MRRWPRFSCRLPTPAAWSFASAPPKRRSSLHAHAPASLWLCLALALVWCQWLPSAKNNARSLPLFCFFHTLIPLIVSTCHICFFSGAAINSVPLMCYCEIFLQKSPFQLRKEKKQKKINNNNSLALMCLPERLFLLYSVKKIKWNLNKNSFYFFLTFIHKNTNINHPVILKLKQVHPFPIFYESNLPFYCFFFSFLYILPPSSSSCLRVGFDTRLRIELYFVQLRLLIVARLRIEQEVLHTTVSDNRIVEISFT